MKYNYSNDTKYIVSNLVNLLYPDTVIPVSEEIEYKFTPLIANLDEDTNPEIIAIMGENYCHAVIVLKEINSKWYIIYRTNYSNENFDPEIVKDNNSSMNKLFCITELRGRGSGIYDVGYAFYKVINNKVYNCLNIIKETYISGWGFYINQNSTASYQVSNIGEDFIWANYQYEFDVGPSLLPDASFNDVQIPIVVGNESIGYYWNDSTYKYLPRYAGKLNNKKIECFEAFGNDSLFVNSFKEDLNNKLKEGNKKVTKIIKKYLSKFNSDR
jgi:hypothetical protein